MYDYVKKENCHCTYLNFQADITFSFIFVITETSKDILLKLLLSFQLVECEVQHGFLISVLTE